MELTIKSTSRSVSKKIVQDHYWYDSNTGQMLHGQGGEMRFRYSNGVTTPYLVDIEQSFQSNNFQDIAQWVQEKDLPVVDYAKNYHITVEVNDSKLEELSYELQQLKMEHDF